MARAELDALHGRLHCGARRAALARERHQRCRIPQGRAVVFAADQVRLRSRRQRLERGRENAFGACAVARHGERRGNLRLGDRRGQRIELGIGDVAKIADRGGAISRQHVERIGEIGAAVLAHVRGVGDRVAQPVERELEGCLRHRDLAFARAGEEVRHVGIEPDVIPADAPQAERAVRILPRQQRLDRLAQLLIGGRIGRDRRVLGKIAQIEKRQRAARDLFRAAERITVERGEQPRRIERRQRADRERYRAGTRHEIGEHVARDREAFALGQWLDRPARHDASGRAHRERVTALQGKAARAADADPHRAVAGGRGGERHIGGATLLRAQGELQVRRGRKRVGARHHDGVVAGRPFDIVEVEMHRRAVARQQEARQRRRQHHRIAHGDIGRAVADLTFAPADRHHAHSAGKVGDVEGNVRRAVGADLHDPRIKRHRRSCRRASLQLGALIAAAADLAARALHAVDQLTVEVADLRRERMLPEIIVIGRRRLVVGEIEDADIDRGDDHARLFAGRHARDLDRNMQGRVRPNERRRLDLDIERLCRAIDREPLHADGAPRHALRRRVERTTQGRDQIGAGAPVAADRQLQLRDALRHVARLRREQAIANHVERQPPRVARGNRDRHRVARRIVALVESDLEHVRRVGIGLDIVTGVEQDRGQRPVRIGGRDFEPVAAEIHRQRNARRAVDGRVDRAVGDAFGRLDRLVIPAPVALIELIMRLDTQQFVMQAALSRGAAIGRDHDHVERCVRTVGERAAGEERLYADHVGSSA